MMALASKNAILIVEFARDLHHKDGLSVTDAAVEATRRRFRPIVMTSFAFILGVVPLMVATGAGAASQQAIGTVVYGGMMASTLLAIPFVPVFYVALEGLSERGGVGGPARPARGAASAVPPAIGPRGRARVGKPGRAVTSLSLDHRS
jgi:HAE1 family hydrophobic/amphiphilic exporter-1